MMMMMMVIIFDDDDDDVNDYDDDDVDDDTMAKPVLKHRDTFLRCLQPCQGLFPPEECFGIICKE